MPKIKIKTNSKKTTTVMKKDKVENSKSSTISPVDPAPNSPVASTKIAEAVPSVEEVLNVDETPVEWKTTIEKEQEKLVKNIAEHFNLDFSEIMKEVMPDYKLSKQKKKKRAPKKREKLTDYKQAVKKEDLKDFKMPALKEILQANNLPVGGNKQRLIDRVWGILHPEEAPEEKPKKKRGRKKKKDSKSDPTTVDCALIEQSHQEEQNECELDFDDMPSIFVDKSGKITDAGDEYKLFKDKFLFKDNDEEDPEFIGIKSGNNVEFTEEHPQELLDMLGC